MTPSWCRYVTDSDRPTIAAWIAMDPDHQDKMDSEFFFKPGHLAFAMGKGEQVGLFLRMDPVNQGVLRLHIQFGPDKIRSAKTLLRGWPTFLWGCRRAAVKYLLFDSTSESLVALCKLKFGFEQVEGVQGLYALALEETCAARPLSKPN